MRPPGEPGPMASPPLPIAFTPSELVYFHAGAFAREKALLDAVKLAHTDTKYDASELATAILSAAILAAEEAGDVVLEPGKVSRLFGLRKVDVLTVKPGPTPGAFPAGTFEARVRPAAASAKQQADAEHVVKGLLEEDSADPHVRAVGLVERGLLERRLLETQEVRQLKVFRSQVFVYPEATAQLVRGTTPEAPSRLLEKAQRERPDVWRLLQEGIRRAASARTERDSGDGPD